jgi:hypothetical protein
VEYWTQGPYGALEMRVDDWSDITNYGAKGFKIQLK